MKPAPISKMIYRMRNEGTRNHKQDLCLSNESRQRHSRQLSIKNTPKGGPNWSSTRYRAINFRKGKVGRGQQLRTSRKYKIATMKNANILGGADPEGVTLKPNIIGDHTLFEMNSNSKGSIRQSYDNSQK